MLKNESDYSFCGKIVYFNKHLSRSTLLIYHVINPYNSVGGVNTS